jgi:hypothetical protein
VYRSFLLQDSSYSLILMCGSRVQYGNAVLCNSSLTELGQATNSFRQSAIRVVGIAISNPLSTWPHNLGNLSREPCTDNKSSLDISHSLQSRILYRSDRLAVSEDTSNLLPSSIRNPNNRPLHHTIFISSVYTSFSRLPHH